MPDPAGSVTGEHRTSGGVIRTTLLPGEGLSRIGSVEFSGTYKENPEGVLRGLEAILEGATIDEAPKLIEGFFAKNPGAVPGIDSGEFFMALSMVFMKVRRAASSAPDPSDWKKEKR